jgi:hypothetical protein
VTVTKPDRLRLAELTSGVGAVVLGVGLGALAADRLGRFGLPLLLIGAVAHAWGMFDKNRIEHQADALDAWWKPVAYWFCWGLLGILAAGVVARFAGDV